MQVLTRRGFAGASLAGLSTLAIPREAFAAAQCVVGQQLPIPNRLSVDCASKQNFQSFRKYPTYFGLAGVVSMAAVTGKSGPVAAGSMFLFPYLKPEAIQQRGAIFHAAFPTGRSTSISTRPIPGATLPQDEYFSHYVLRAPAKQFIGFLVETPWTLEQTRSGWVSNMPKLADGEIVGVDWTSSNLNGSWFGGSRFIPDTPDCHGDTWRSLITDGLNQAAAGAC